MKMPNIKKDEYKRFRQWKAQQEVEASLASTFNLDDDILDDQIRTKEIFANNIDPFLWDDANFAKEAMNAETPYHSGTSSTITVKDKNTNKVLTGDAAEEELAKRRTQDSASWSMLPSRWRVGVSMLAKEVRNMYDGELTLVGNPQIKPYDVIHILDYTNGMQGAVVRLPLECGLISLDDPTRALIISGPEVSVGLNK